MAKIPVTTDDEFLAEHLPYELNMLRDTRTLVLAAIQVPQIENALMESFAIHARNLHEFLSNDSDCHFRFSAFVDGIDPAPRSFLSKDLIAKINTQIAHLTRRRTGDDDHKLGDDDRAEIARCIGVEVVRMIRCLKEPYLQILAATPAWQPIRSEFGL